MRNNEGIKIFLVIFLILQLKIIGFSLEPILKIYRLNKAIDHADFDYGMLRNIDQLPPPYPPDSPYQIGDLPIIKGQYTVYKFIAEYEGDSFKGRKVLFHDLLLIKADKANKILDALHYTLEWTDTPSLDLYRLQNKKLYLKEGLKIKELKLRNPETDRELIENGVIEIGKKHPKSIDSFGLSL